jgi:putative Mg2+ transporter-C (MgtC) family protein
MTLTLTEFCLRALIAVLLGLMVGIDREVKRKPMGARVYMLVSLGSCAYMMTALNFMFSPMTVGDAALSIDPTKIIDGVIGAIGFLGAGAILSQTRKGKVKGISTGAGVWAVGAVGIACAFGHFAQAFVVALLALAILSITEWFEENAEEVGEEVAKKAKAAKNKD